MIVGIKIFYRKILHPIKHFLPQLFQSPLGNNRHHLSKSDPSRQGNCIKRYQNSYKFPNFPGNCRPVAALPALLYQSNDILHKYSRYRTHHRIQQHTHNHQRHQYRIKFKQHLNHSFERSLFLTLHPLHPLYSEMYILPGKLRSFSAALHDFPLPGLSRRP